MKTENLLKAIEIITAHHSTKMTINKVKSGEVVSSARTLVIHNCVPSVINKLRDEGFMLSMTDEGLTIHDIGM